MKVTPAFPSLLFVVLLSPCSLFSETAFGLQEDGASCAGRVSDSYATPIGVFKLFNVHTGRTNWACLDEVPLASTSDAGDGLHYSFSKSCVLCYDYARENGKLVRRDDRPLILRAVIVENRRQANDNKYYLLDFRGKEPLVVGPFGAHEAGEVPSIIWNDRSVIVVLDNSAVDWPPGPRYIERNEKGEGSYEVDDEGTPIPHINRDGKLLGKDGKPRTYPLGVCYIAFVYDYDQQKLYKAYIDE